MGFRLRFSRLNQSIDHCNHWSWESRSQDLVIFLQVSDQVTLCHTAQRHEKINPGFSRRVYELASISPHSKLDYCHQQLSSGVMIGFRMIIGL